VPTASDGPASGVLIGGKWRVHGPESSVYDKFTRQPCAVIKQARPGDAGDAVTTAVRAADCLLPPMHRYGILSAASRLLLERAAVVRSAYIAETGFTAADADGEIARAAATLRLSGEEALRVAGEEIPVAATPGSEHRLAFTVRVPVGVVGAIAPFNAPLSTVAHKIGPAIAAGNAVVLKPAEQTPLSAIALVEILHEAGLPPGYLNLICGPGDVTGAELVADRRVRYFTFTGSTAVGLLVKQRSGIAKTHLELGSNSACIVAADADLDLVSDLVTRAGYRKAGQVCTSVQRLIADIRVIDDLADRLRARVAALRTGDPRDPSVQVGPMIAPEEADRALCWVSEAVSGGATLLAGGRRDGPVLQPTVLRDPPADAKIMTDEIFAPAVALVPAESVDAAVDMVNSGSYGLQAGVFTRDINVAFGIARRLRVGGVMVNDTSSYHADAMPYGGVKDSGFGLEGPKYAVSDMTDPRIIVLNLPPATKGAIRQ
jgi:acyl-CoA reductase-like NAD-dependent aldehyde dehydrogenase